MKINKIALINPKIKSWAKNPRINEIFEQRMMFIRPWHSPPLSLLTIAGATPRNINITFIDEEFESIDFNERFDLVGISSMTQQIYRAYEIAKEYKNNKIPVILGGIHATVLPEEALQHANTVIIGEGEILWDYCLRDYENSTPKKIYQNSRNDFIDLSKSPIPRYDLIKKENIITNNSFFNMIPIQVTRGCSHDCNFCVVSKIYGRKIRKKEINQIIKEIKIIQNLFGRKIILFADDNLFVDRKFIKALLKIILPLKINWAGQSDVSIAEDDELLRLAYLSGCTSLLIGFESLDENNLADVNSSQWKMKQVHKYSEIVKKIQENGIKAYCSFIIGQDNDDKNTFIKIRDFIISNHCVGQFCILTPLPGSKLYENLKNEKRLLKNNFWDQCNFYDVAFMPNKLTINEIEDGIIWLYKEIYNSEMFNERFEYMKNIIKKLPTRWETIY